MLTYFSVRNFKCLGNVQFSPRPINVLIGPNGSGKSALLQSIDFLRAFFMSSVELYLKEKEWDYSDLPSLKQTTRKITWTIGANLPPDPQGKGAGVYRYNIELTPRRYLGIGMELLTYRSPSDNQEITLLNRRGRQVSYLDRKAGREEKNTIVRLPASLMSTFDPVRDKEKYPEMIRFRKWVEGFRYFLIWDPKILRSIDRGRHEMLGASGEHLAPILALLKRENPHGFDRLASRIRDLFPSVSGISVSGGRGWGWRSVRLHEKGNTETIFNSRQISDGVLRLLAVISLLHLGRTPSLIMFEEPENGVHPQLIREVVQILRELTQRKPPNDAQVIFSTHSPYVLDAFYDHPDEVFVMERSKPQSDSSITQLSKSSQIAHVREEFQGSLGEAWYSGMIGGTALGRR